MVQCVGEVHHFSATSNTKSNCWKSFQTYGSQQWPGVFTMFHFFSHGFHVFGMQTSLEKTLFILQHCIVKCKQNLVFPFSFVLLVVQKLLPLKWSTLKNRNVAIKSMSFQTFCHDCCQIWSMKPIQFYKPPISALLSWSFNHVDVDWCYISNHLVFSKILASFTACRKATSSSSVCHLSKISFTSERSLDHSSRHSISPKSVRLDESANESVSSFAIASANVKYPGLHSRAASTEMNQVL